MDRPRRLDALNPSLMKNLTSWVDNPRPLGCPQMNLGRTLKYALQSNDLPTKVVERRDIVADQKQLSTLEPLE
jgi:hypothetical protein